MGEPEEQVVGVMPKQMIYPFPNPDGSDADRRIEVGWQRNLGVQVGTTTVVNPGTIRVGPGGVEGETAPRWDGAFVDLDRGQINELIRSLRRARDAAYGRDQ